MKFIARCQNAACTHAYKHLHIDVHVHRTALAVHRHGAHATLVQLVVVVIVCCGCTHHTMPTNPDQAERGIATLFLCGVGTFTGLGLANAIANAEPNWADTKPTKYMVRTMVTTGFGFMLFGGIVMPAVWLYRMNSRN